MNSVQQYTAIVDSVHHSSGSRILHFTEKDECEHHLNRIEYLSTLRVHFFKKIQYWTLKSERIRKRVLRFLTKQVNPRPLRSRCVKGTEESTVGVDFSVPLTHHDPRNLRLICLVRKRKIRFRILSDSRIQSWIFLKKRALSVSHSPHSLSLCYFTLAFPLKPTG